MKHVCAAVPPRIAEAGSGSSCLRFRFGLGSGLDGGGLFLAVVFVFTMIIYKYLQKETTILDNPSYTTSTLQTCAG